MAEAEADSKRASLAGVVGLSIPPARTRRYLDNKGLNASFEGQLAPLREKLDELRLKGGPSVPKRPDDLVANATEEQKAAHTKEREAYLAAKAASDRYVSVEFAHAEHTAWALDYMSELYNLMTEPIATGQRKPEDIAKEKANIGKECQSIRDILNDKDQIHMYGLADRLGGVDLTDPKAVQKRREAILATEPAAKLFVDAKVIVKQKFRISEQALTGIAATLQAILEELSDNAIEACVDDKRKTIGVDHCLGKKYKSLPLYPLWKDLKHVKIVEDRMKRRALYEEDIKLDRKKFLKNQIKHRQRGSGTEEKVEFVPETFNDREVKMNYARKETFINAKGDTVHGYVWFGIDEEGPDHEEESDFSHFGHAICRRSVQGFAEEGEVNDKTIKVSQDLKKFFSDVCIDYIYKLVPMIDVILRYSETRTVTIDVLKAVTEMILLNGTQAEKGSIDVPSDHKRLLHFISDKAKKCQEHQRKNRTTTNAGLKDSAAAVVLGDHLRLEEPKQEKKKPIVHVEEPAAPPAPDSDLDLDLDVAVPPVNINNSPKKPAAKPAAKK